MQEKEWISQVDAEMQSLIEEYVLQQDFHALETPLKSDQQLKNDLRSHLKETYNFKSLSDGIRNAIDLIRAETKTHRDTAKEEKVEQELAHAFTAFNEFYQKRKENALYQEASKLEAHESLWTKLYGISDETLLIIYNLVLKCFKNKEIENAKNLLRILLLFAPIVPAYWNGLGFCYQTEGDSEQALRNYLLAESIDPEHFDTHFYLARCYLAMNNKTLAKEQVEKLNKLVAASPQLKGQWENAIAQLEQDINTQ
jgi:tetratricopeptide (TPR) repeat protein